MKKPSTAATLGNAEHRPSRKETGSVAAGKVRRPDCSFGKNPYEDLKGFTPARDGLHQRPFDRPSPSQEERGWKKMLDALI
jgi:hypothetical protein